MIPAEMTGGWIRHGIALDGAEPVEDAVVWWLQAPSKHCDLRVPFDTDGIEGLMCFAGTTTWADPSLTWSPELELDASTATDVGVIGWDGEDLMEAGTFVDGGRAVSYVERWRRLPHSDGELLALSRPHGRLVRTGPYALTIVDERPIGGSFAAIAWTLENGTWTVDHRWPASAIAAAPPAAVTGAGTTVVLSDGVEWSIDEHRSTRH